MRLISFLGTGNYSDTNYSFESSTCQTRYVAHALASLKRPNEIRLIATAEAWSQHGHNVTEVLTSAGHTNVKQVEIPTTGDSDNLWTIFGRIVDVIRASQDDVLFDITHGFRAHPFFASACIQYVQAVIPDPPLITVVYGEYRKDEEKSPIWNLTPFLDVLAWSRNLMMFLRTGQADEVVAPTKALGRELRKKWVETDRKNPQPGLENLGKALEAFGSDFTTIRTGSLLIGKQPSALRLCDAIERTKDEVAQQLPALGLVLDQVRAMVEPLRTGGARLSSADGQRALIALARLYQKMGRYSEAISVLREGWSTMDAPANCDHPGTVEFIDEERKQWDGKWAYRDGHADPTTEVRNDILHAGFRTKPNRPDWFEKQLTTLLTQWQTAIDSMEHNHSE